MSENQKKVWITGASSGIGKATAEKFAKENWKVAISARRENLLKEISKSQNNIDYFPLDVTDIEKCKTVFNDVKKKLGDVNISVFCTGIHDPKSEKKLNLEKIRKIMEVNFFGTVNSINAVYDYYKDKGDSFNLVGAKTFKGDFIQTSSGKVLSQRTEGILYWEDIPFAVPPLGNLRWKAPVAFVAKDFHINPKENNFCHQELGGQIQEINKAGSEDCLYLDIRAPHGKRDNLPVMFWIHGGGNTSGHKDFYDFTKFVKKEEIN